MWLVLPSQKLNQLTAWRMYTAIACAVCSRRTSTFLLKYSLDHLLTADPPQPGESHGSDLPTPAFGVHR